MTEAQIKHMVDRFLRWRLPETFNPDGGISFTKIFGEHTAHPMRNTPVGTNLFDANQATEMVRYMLEDIPSASPAAEPSPCTGDIEKSKKALLDWHERLLPETGKRQSFVMLQMHDAQRLVDDLLDAALSLEEKRLAIPRDASGLPARRGIRRSLC